MNQLFEPPVVRIYDMTSQVDSNGVDCFEYNELEVDVLNNNFNEAENIEAENEKEKLTVATRLRS